MQNRKRDTDVQNRILDLGVSCIPLIVCSRRYAAVRNYKESGEREDYLEY